MTQNLKSNHIVNQYQLDELGKSWSRLIECISHDISSPLATLRATGKSLEAVFPQLIKAYKLAVEHKLEVPEISERMLKPLERLVPNIGQEVDNLANFLNLLPPYDKKLISDSQDIQSFSVKSCVDNLLDHFPFATGEERKLVHVECQHDFQLRCAPIYIDNLLINLLENALRAIDKAKKGEITIWTSEDGDYNILHFKDTSLGMDEDACHKVFRRFFRRIDGAVMPGLGFCRLAILQMDGNVTCQSKAGGYTEFQIKIPKS